MDDLLGCLGAVLLTIVICILTIIPWAIGIVEMLKMIFG